MRVLILVLAVIASFAPLTAQETRTEVTRATTPAEDSKPNSDVVPDVQPILGNLERVVLFRFKNQADVLEG